MAQLVNLSDWLFCPANIYPALNLCCIDNGNVYTFHKKEYQRNTQEHISSTQGGVAVTKPVKILAFGGFVILHRGPIKVFNLFPKKLPFGRI